MPQPLPSPDGRFVVRFTCDLAGTSDFVYSPVLVDLSDGSILFTLSGTPWSAEVAAWTDDSQTLVIGLRCLAGRSPSVCVRIEVCQRLACLDDSAYSLPLNQLYERLESRYHDWCSTRIARA